MKEINGDIFDTFMQNVEEPVLVLFGADWCQPCKRFKPVFEWSAKHNRHVTHVYANVDTLSKQTLAEYDVMSVPRLVMVNANSKRIVENSYQAILEEVQNV